MTHPRSPLALTTLAALLTAGPGLTAAAEPGCNACVTRDNEAISAEAQQYAAALEGKRFAAADHDHADHADGHGHGDKDAADHHDDHADEQAVGEQVAAAHGGEAYRAHEAVSADFELDFPGMFSWKGNMVFDTPAGRSKITLDDGTVITNDGETVSVFPADVELPLPMARFHSLTWPYFAAAPFKLADEGATLHDPAPQPWEDGTLRNARQLTFGEGVGDAPDDWYYVFTDDEHQLRGMSYIVTFGSEKKKAEESPSAIVYKGYADVDGVLLSTVWDFHHWDKEKGLKDQKASGELMNVEFVEIDEDTFAHPEGAKSE